MNEENKAVDLTTKDDCVNLLCSMKRALRDDMDRYFKFLGLMKGFDPNYSHDIVKQVKQLFKEYPVLLVGFKKLLPPSLLSTFEDFLPESSIAVNNENDSCQKMKDSADEDEKYCSPVNRQHKTPLDMDDALCLVRKIRDRFLSTGEAGKYESFVNLLTLYQNDYKSLKDVSQEVVSLLHEHQDLCQELISFFPPDLVGSALHHIPTNKSLRAYNREKHAKHEKSILGDRKGQHYESSEKSSKLGKNNADNLLSKEKLVKGHQNSMPEHFQDRRAKKCSIGGKGMYTKCENNNLDRENLNASSNSTEMKGLTRTNLFNSSVSGCQKGNLLSKDREQNTGKQDSELDLSNTKLCTPSYRLLPHNYLLPPASYRTEVDASILNDAVVSVTSGSEDCSFKTTQSNHYAETLFRCEDDRYEVDMMLGLVKATIQKVQRLLDTINCGKLKLEADFRIENHLDSRNMRCVESLYGEHGLEVIDSLHKNVKATLLVVLPRLKQKLEEWTRFRTDFQKIWAEIDAKSYYKSLDYRSFNFKLQDATNLSPKAFLAEVKEVSGKMIEEDDELLASVFQNELPRCPHFEFEYTDKELLKEMYHIIKFSCKEICTPEEQQKKVIRIWRNFLEPLFGIFSVDPNVEIPEENMHGTTAPFTGKATYRHDTKDATVDIKHSIRSPIIDENKREQGNQWIGYSNRGNKKVEPECRINLSTHEVKPVFALGKQKSKKHPSTADLMPGFSNDNACLPIQDANSDSENQIQGNDRVLPHKLTPTNYDKDDEREEGECSPEPAYKENIFENSDGGFTNKVLKGSFYHENCESCPGDLKPCDEEGQCVRDGDSNVSNKEDGIPRRSSNKKPDPSDTVEYASGNEQESCEELSGDREDDNVENNDGNDDEHDSEESADLDPVRCPVKLDELTKLDDGNDDEHDNEESVDLDSIGCTVELDELTKIAEPEAEGTSLGFSGSHLLTSKPLAVKARNLSVSEDRRSRIFYGGSSFYVLFRLHEVLYRRLLFAKTNSLAVEKKLRTLHHMNPSNSYAKFMNSLYSLLDGSIDNAKFEDICLAAFGSQSYVLFTLDKLIFRIVKQLQTMASDEIDREFIQLYEYETSRMAKRFSSFVYQENAFVIQGEPIFRFQFSLDPIKLSIQWIEDTHTESKLTRTSSNPEFATYLRDDFLSNDLDNEESDVFLRRNIRKHSDGAKVMEGFHIVNGLLCRMQKSSMVYILDTEDFLFRARKRRKNFVGASQSSHDGRKKLRGIFCQN